MWDLDAIRQRVTMRDVLAWYGIGVDRAGFAVCPFHSDRHPSMKIYPGDRGFYCFVCHEGGDVLRFIRSKEGCSFPEAVSIAARIGGISEAGRTGDAARAELERRKRNDSRKAAERIREELHRQWILAVGRVKFLTELAAGCTVWTETLESILTEREDMRRLAERIEERLQAYERTT